MTRIYKASLSIYFILYSVFIQADSLTPLSPLSIPEANNFSNDARLQSKSSKVILLYVSAPHCAFCKKLEKEIIYPLLRSGEYKDKIILRKIDWHGDNSIINFEGKITNPHEFLANYRIQVTPTLLFLNREGKEIHKRLLGYQGGEFYWYYFDAAINKSNNIISSNKRITFENQL